MKVNLIPKKAFNLIGLPIFLSLFLIEFNFFNKEIKAEKNYLLQQKKIYIYIKEWALHTFV